MMKRLNRCDIIGRITRNHPIVPNTKRLDDTADIPTRNQLQKIEPFAKNTAEESKSSGANAAVEEKMTRSFPDGFTHRDEANALIAMAVRNGPREKLHAGKYSEWLEDDTLSRLTNDEIRILTINATRMLELLLKMRDETPDVYRQFNQKYGGDYCRAWERNM